MSTDQPPRERPETPRQAQHWETVKNRYLQAGLCRRCAAQAAWGHQCGFRLIHPPCQVCRAIKLPTELVERHGQRPVKWLRGQEILSTEDDPSP